MRSLAVLLVSVGVLGFVGSQAARPAPGRQAASSSRPVALSPADPLIDGSQPQVAVDASGDAFAVWQEARTNGSFTRAAFKPARAGWGAARTLARGGYVSLAVDARGDAVVAGLTLADRQGIFAVYRPAGGDWGRAVLLGRSGFSEGLGLSAAIDADHRALVAWVSTAGRVELSTRERGHWTTQAVGDGDDPALAVNDSGDALVAWHTPPDADGRFFASWNTSGRGWQRPRPVPFAAGAPVRPEQPQLTLDDRGNAALSWTNWDANVFISSAARGGGFGVPQDMQIGYDGLQARAVVAAGGGSVLEAVGNRGNGPLELRTRSSATAGWRAPVMLDHAALQSAVALDRANRLLVAWVGHDDTGTGYGQLVLRLATGSTAGHVSTPLTLATIGDDCWMHRCNHGGNPAVAIGSRGQAIIAWVSKPDPNHGAGVVMATGVNLSHG